MDKRYQVFVSSTYEDLRVERAEVMQALLELDCMPAGMELFPAATEEQWSWIARVIEESDYYAVIVGGRYGSVHPGKGLSFTELEYRYAVEAGKPVVAFLHGSPSDIPAGKTEKDPELLAKLLEFRQYCQQRLCKYWDNPPDLGGKVSRSMTQLIKRHPATGWIRADAITAEQRIADVSLREEVARLKEELGATAHRLSPTLASGDDPVIVSFHFETKIAKIGKTGNRYWVVGEDFWHKTQLSWNVILRVIGALLFTDPQEGEIMRELNSFAMHNLPPATEGIGRDKIVQATRIS